MLEFNQNHKVADTSSIRHKLVKTGGKVLLCGILISSILLLSGCGAKKEVTTNDNLTPVATAIIMTNDNALLMDLSRYDNLFDRNFSNGKSLSRVSDMNGDELILSHEDAIIVVGENSHERAEKMAEALVGEKGEVICYDEMQNHVKSK